MFEAISRLFRDPTPKPGLQPMEPRLAVAAILVHLAAADGSFTPEERSTISGTLRDHFDLDEAAVERLIAEGIRRDADAVDLYQFTTILAELPLEERLGIIRMMWSVVYTDRTNHELEDNLVWRVAELIGVSARDRMELRNQMRRG